MLFGFVAAGHAQPKAQEPPVQRELPTPRQQYGPAQPEELVALTLNPESYQRRNVVTRGHLGLLPGDRWSLGDGGSTLLLIPVPELSEGGLRGHLGQRVEVTGIIRVLPYQQGTCQMGRQRVPASLCDDPALPALPDGRPEWPKGSITATGLSAIDDYRAAGPRRGTSSIGDALADPAVRAGKSVRVVGQFRGANLFGDLPAESRRQPGDWILKDGDQALWVTGRPPKGKGFELDTANKSDTGRWLQVDGKIEAAGAVAYLKASSIQLVARPAAPSEDNP